MRGWLLDTNVLSELRKPRPNKRVIDNIERQPLETMFVSMVTLAEFRFGIERESDASLRSDLADWLTHLIRPMFDRRVLPLSEDTVLKWRLMLDAGRKAGRTPSQPDLLIAATAAHHGLTVVTRDVAEFERSGVAVVDPWHADL